MPVIVLYTAGGQRVECESDVENKFWFAQVAVQYVHSIWLAGSERPEKAPEGYEQVEMKTEAGQDVVFFCWRGFIPTTMANIRPFKWRITSTTKPAPSVRWDSDSSSPPGNGFIRGLDK